MSKNMNCEKSSLTFSAAILAFGMAIAGFFISGGLAEARKSERFVTVKGVSEREVKANLAFWPIKYVATGNILTEVQNKIEKDTIMIKTFLLENGLKENEITVIRFDVTDMMAQLYRSGPVDSRFIVSQTLMVRTNSINEIDKASQTIGSLVNKGVVLNNEMPYSGVSYTFNNLNEYKLEMIAEATKNARQGAEKFASDSGSKVGAIRRANQGVFQILERDEMPVYEPNRQINKIIRVVSTIDFFIKD